MFRVAEFRFLVPLLRAQWRSYALGPLLVLLTSIFVVAIPKLVGVAIQHLESGIRVDLVFPLALAIVGVVLLRGITAF